MSYLFNASNFVNKQTEEQLALALDKQATFLTPNTRLAAHLNKIIDTLSANRVKNAEVCWPSINILPFDAWAMSIWNARLLRGELPAKLVLSSSQDIQYWEQVISESTYGQSLLSLSSTAKLAQQGYQLLRQWQIDIEEQAFDFSSSLDSEAFYHWINAYEESLSATEHIAFVDAQTHLLSLDLEDDMPPIIMVGFQSPSPLQIELAKNLSSKSHKVTQLYLKRKNEQTSIISCVDFPDELIAASRWAKLRSAEDPSANIAVVIQNLAQNKLATERVFQQYFDEDALNTGGISSAGAFNISAGTPLSETATVSIALSLIETMVAPLAIDRWSFLLCSAYLGDESIDLEFRRALISSCHSAGNAEFTLTQIARLFEWDKPNFKTFVNIGAKGNEHPFQIRLNQCVNRSRSLRRRTKEKSTQYPSQWIAEIQAVLEDFGWPGNRTLNSDEYQQCQRFSACCDSFSSLDAVVGNVGLSQAIRLFKSHCHDSTYHRETTDDAGKGNIVQVLGSLEASGQTFDYLWLVGMSERQWPQPPKTHPLIPRSLQIENNMPSASSEQEFVYAGALTEAYLNSAKNIVVSYPSVIDEIPVHLSPLVNSLINDSSLVEMPRETYNGVEGSSLEPMNDSPLEHVADHFGLSYPDAQQEEVNSVLKGGASMLKDQAENPFKAYIKWRLGIRALGPIVTGVSPLERGNTTHAALEYIWQALGGSASLHDCTDAQLLTLVIESIESTFDKIISRRFESIPSRLLALEKQRLQTTLETWLSLEKQRPDFLIKSLEESLDVQLEGYTIHLRIDRMDRLTDDSLLLLDYKTGLTKPSGWWDDRISDPQLPLYLYALRQLLALDNKGSGALYVPGSLGFASLKSGQIAIDGIAEDESVALDIKGITTISKRRNHNRVDWADLENHWNKGLASLMREILQGYAAVDTLRTKSVDTELEAIMRLRVSETTSTLNELG